MSPPPLEAKDFKTLDAEFDYLLKSIQDGAARIKNIVSDLKTFARVDSSDEHKAVDLNEVVKAAVQLTGSFIKKATDSFVLSLSSEKVVVNGMFQRLEQVVINLIQNACDALADRSKSIRISTETFDGGRVVIRVTDEGVGISPDNLLHVTDPFFTTKRDRGGTGLGLSVSEGIITNHGGSIHYSSAEGKGTDVRVILPERVAL